MTNERRITMERQMGKAVVDALLAAGYTLCVWNGGEEPEIKDSTDATAIKQALRLADDDMLVARKDGKVAKAWLVYGNDGWDTLADYSESLDSILGEGSEVQKLSDKYSEEL